MKKSTLCFGAIVLATGLCAAPLGFAAPEETVASTAEQPSAADTVQAVHTAEFTDAQGNSVKVVTFSDGSVAASVNGAPLVMGAEAMQTLAAHGISISVAPTGEITGVTTAAGTAVTQAAHAVTAAEAKTAAESVQAAAQDEATTQAPAQAPHRFFPSCQRTSRREVACKRSSRLRKRNLPRPRRVLPTASKWIKEAG